MKKKKIFLGSTMAAVGLAALTISGSVVAQPGSNRIELQQHDLSIPGREVLQVIVNLGEGETSPRHRHPGEEIIYVLEGVLEYQIGDNPPVTLKAGEVLFVPYGMIHLAKNVGKGNAGELATYVVEKGKPLIEIAQ